MSDEIKNVDTKIAQAEPSPTLPEQELEQVVGGTTKTDKASPNLYELCNSGKHIPKVTIE